MPGEAAVLIWLEGVLERGTPTSRYSSPRTAPRSPRAAGIRWRSGCASPWRRKGIAFHQHRFRSTRAQQLHAAGVPDSSIVEMLGWGAESGARMLHRYVGRVPLSGRAHYRAWVRTHHTPRWQMWLGPATRAYMNLTVSVELP